MPQKKKTAPQTRKPKPKAAGNKAGLSGPQALAGTSFPIVGLGASAGGLEALNTFFAHVPAESPMAYIVVVHMARNQPSMLSELLQRVTPLPVVTVKDGQAVEPGHVYVGRPDKEIALYKGTVQLLDIVDRGIPHPIDLLLRSLAQDQGRRAAAVILSGTGTDGALGIKEINANEGVVLVQSEASAAYDGMPRSAISTGLADVILPPEEMPAKLLQFFAHTQKVLARKSAAPVKPEKWLQKIFAILRAQVGHDFSGYKANTILRRIDRRMGINQVDSHDTYVRYLRENPAEVETLFRELLIGVTNFFRDPASFEVLQTGILPERIAKVKDDDTFRAWIPGCSTGEEVYSLAIVLRELCHKASRQVNLQLFGTDIDEVAVDKAREGLFPDSIVADVSQERLRRFFTKEGNFFRIRKEIRDCVVFSVQNVIKDPPFSRLDLLCCRNLLIYLDTELQKRLLPLFHYTLKPEGVLVLGSSETIGGFTRLFKTLDKKWKVYRRQEIPHALRQMVDFPSGLPAEAGGRQTAGLLPTVQPTDIARITRGIILDQFAPTAILVDAGGEILHIQGRTGKYLEALSGPPTQNILNLARQGLRIELSSALRAARAGQEMVKRENITVQTNGSRQTLNLQVCPLQTPKELAGRFLVVFEDLAAPPESAAADPGNGDSPPGEQTRIADLERELQINRESHQTTIEELESSNEELKSTNEELQSSNEELQSTNEELESSKEELQSLNEELQTVNAELQSKVEELSAVQDDMRNLLNSTEIATIFVDNDLRVRRFTREATAIVNLIQTDVGRPLQHVVNNLTYVHMIADLEDVLRNLVPRETEVQTTAGNWYNMRIIPYRTVDNRIDGGVLTFASIDEQKQAHTVITAASRKLEQALELSRALFDMNTQPMVVLDDAFKTVLGNAAFAELMDLAPEQVDNLDMRSAPAMFPGHVDLTARLKTALKAETGFETRAFTLNASKNKIRCRIQGRIILKDADVPYRVLLQYLQEQ